MVTFTSHDFDATFEKWKDWQLTPWNRLLYSTTHLNLHRHLGDEPLRVIDIGGGNGVDTIHLAELGHSAVLVDFSAEMLADAYTRAEQAGFLDQVVFCQSDITDLTAHFPGGQFDLALCHNMIQFIDGNKDLLMDIHKLLVPGGLLSLTSANRYSQVYRDAIIENDLMSAVRAIKETKAQHPWFGKPETRHSADEMIEYLETIGFTHEGHYGLRCIVDYLPDNAHKYDPGYFAELERMEHTLTDTYPYYLLARMFQLIVRKLPQGG